MVLSAASKRVAVTAPAVAARKGSGEPPLVMVTAYDAPSARAVDAAGADMILVGDSVAMVVLGYDDTLQVTIDDMVHHVGAVARSHPAALVVGDLPWLSYHVSRAETVHNAASLVRAGAGAVKLEGGAKRIESVRAILDAEIPVMGHIGLTPQTATALGGYKAQGKTAKSAIQLCEDALALQAVGCFAIVFEAIPSALTGEIMPTMAIPVIGIGAGPSTDGQVLVFHDLLGIREGLGARFVKRYADLLDAMATGVSAFAADVRGRSYPAPEHGYSMPEEELAGLRAALQGS